MVEVAGGRGRYRIEGELGQGGMGIVYRARQLETGLAVALKILRTPWPDADLRARFEQEARLGEELSHEALVRILDHGHDPAGRAFLVMELVEGETLEAIVKRGLLPATRAAQIVGRLARGLDAAHRRGVVHRDVKPANVIVARDGTVKLTDFGLARDLRTARLTMDGAIVGTPSYMAPEQVAGAAVDGRADVHALGVLLYSLLTGRLPYKGQTDQETFQQVVYSPPVLPSKLASVDDALESIVLRALAKRPDDRFPRASDLASALEAWATGGAAPSAATRPSVVPKVALGLVALLALGGAAGAGAWYLHAKTTAGSSPPVPTPQPTAPPEVPKAPPRNEAAATFLARARERLRRGEIAAAVEHDLAQSIEADPTDPDPHLELARVRARVGDLAGAKREIERASALRPRAPRETEELLATARRELADETAAQERLLAVTEQEEKAFRTRSALAGLVEAERARPEAARVKLRLAKLLAWHGRIEDAARASDEARRLDPSLEPAFADEAREIVQASLEAHVTPPAGSEPPSDAWEPFFGGIWGQREGELVGLGMGIGPFSLAALIRADLPALESYKASVELLLETERSRGVAYAGLIFGARSPDDFFAVYVFDHPGQIARGVGKRGWDEYVARMKSRPKVLRVARILNGRWEPRARDTIVAFPDEGWTRLSVSVAGGDEAVIAVDDQSQTVKLDRPLDGRVGVLKYYETAVRVRNWQAGRE